MNKENLQYRYANDYDVVAREMLLQRDDRWRYIFGRQCARSDILLLAALMILDSARFIEEYRGGKAIANDESITL